MQSLHLLTKLNLLNWQSQYKVKSIQWLYVHLSDLLYSVHLITIPYEYLDRTTV